MACLGGRVEVSVLGTATGVPAAVVDQRLAPALAEGLLVVEPGTNQAVRFRHDRIREVVLGRLDPPRRRTLQLTMARRLAGASELFAVAAEQYLPGVDKVDDPAERRQVVGLLRRAADQAGLIGDHALVTALLTARLRLVDPGDTATLVTVHTTLHHVVERRHPRHLLHEPVQQGGLGRHRAALGGQRQLVVVGVQAGDDLGGFRLPIAVAGLRDRPCLAAERRDAGTGPRHGDRHDVIVQAAHRVEGRELPRACGCPKLGAPYATC